MAADRSAGTDAKLWLAIAAVLWSPVTALVQLADELDAQLPGTSITARISIAIGNYEDNSLRQARGLPMRHGSWRGHQTDKHVIEPGHV